MMKKWIFLLPLLFLISCKEETSNSYFTVEKASEYFRTIKDICDRDNGNLWGQNLYGPIMFVERTSRRVTANQADNEGLLKGKDGVFTGFYPKELVLSDQPVVFGGKTFAMVPLPAEEDDYRIKSRSVHALFHLLQKSYGIDGQIFNAMNMDEKAARLWIKLEWKALRKALDSEGEERTQAIRDALVFRGSNREFYIAFAKNGNQFEAHEGLATFTQAKLCTANAEELKTKLIEYLDRFYSIPSFTRSYGLIHGALYASLLNDKGYDFHQIKSDTIDLGKEVQKAYNIELPEICRDIAGSLAFCYDVDIINKEEEKRLTDIQKRLDKQLSTFTEKTVVFLELESPYFDFEPEDIHPLDTMGILYSSMRVSDNWGKLTVDAGGCLVANNYKYLRLTAKGYKTAKNRVSGEGWHLILNDGWELVEVSENYFLRKLMPLKSI